MRTYLVRLKGASPVVTHKALLPAVKSGAEKTQGGASLRAKVDSAPVKAYVDQLKASHVDTLARAKIPSERKFYSYTYLTNGFAATLTPAEAQALLADPTVASVTSDSFEIMAQTSHSPAFLNLSGATWPKVGGYSHAGDDVIIGVIDSGIWPEHAGFSESLTNRYAPPPARWTGACATTPDFPACNRKVIGASYFLDGFRRAGGVPKAGVEHVSPRDSNGHGSHVASIAAAHAYSISANGVNYGKATGVAPRARLAVYKVLWTHESGHQAATLVDTWAAVDQAASDGVDIINLSIGAGTDFMGLIEIALLEATTAGILAVCAAGNDGTTPGAMKNSAPWQLTVASTTTDRKYSHTVTLSDASASKYPGTSWTAGTGPIPLPLITSTRAALGIVDPSAAAQCYPGTLDPARVGGKIVICNMGGNHAVEKGQAVLDAGGSGMILVSEIRDPFTTPSDFHRLPAVSVGYSDGGEIIEYANSARTPLAMISANVATYMERAPMIDSTSTRGPITGARPTSSLNYVLKPDLAAPGVEIWGAWTGDQTLRGAPMTANVLSGTSQAAPHVAGAAALVRQAHPGWSTFAVKSALVTSARRRDSTRRLIGSLPGGVASTPFEAGSGCLDPASSLNPGLVYDSSRDEMVRFLLGIDPERAARNFFIPADVSPLSARELNLPSLACPSLGATSVAFRRVLRSVSPVTEHYQAWLGNPPGVEIAVIPGTFSIAPGASRTVEIQLIRRAVPADPYWAHGSLTWMSEKGLEVRF
eukprot:jgi/Mesen1/5712/ME000289S04815